VITASPHLPSMAILVNTLNDTRDVFAFIRDVRAAYRPLVSLSLDTTFKVSFVLLAQFDVRSRWNNLYLSARCIVSGKLCIEEVLFVTASSWTVLDRHVSIIVHLSSYHGHLYLYICDISIIQMCKASWMSISGDSCSAFLVVSLDVYLYHSKSTKTSI
jgi:hypothetical protein